tara:strand:- start:1036 stop:1365 length:330 start_codon:yes stop_codon:yes gene_type:complete
MGMAYKGDVDDVRESPSLDVLRLLEEEGAIVEYHDPLVDLIKWGGKIKKSLKISKINFQDFDLIVILTNHSDVDYQNILDSGTLIVDTRNVYEGIKRKNIIRLGERELL